MKLEAAIAAFSIGVEGKVALDLGASTGGFTDCLLQHGAARVIAVDVGHGQLAPSLRTDPRVISMEGVNARSLTPEDIVSRPDLVVCDLSFISQTLIYPAVAKLLDCGGVFVTLIKPQFEAGRDKLGKKRDCSRPKGSCCRYHLSLFCRKRIWPLSGSRHSLSYHGRRRKPRISCAFPEREGMSSSPDGRHSEGSFWFVSIKMQIYMQGVNKNDTE